MASKTAVLAVKIITDAKGGTKGMDDAATGVQKFQKRLDRLAVPAGLALAAVKNLADGARDSASALEQSTGGVESIFKEHADEVKRYASEAAENVGLATSEYQDLATVIGAQLKNMGTPMEAVAGQTNELVSLGADLAATFGGTTADAVSALSSLLRGERDPIERYGVSINEAAVKAKMAEMGLDGLSGEAEKNAKLQATLALLTQQTADAQGQFAREADTVAGATQIATARAEDMRAKIGTKLLPLYTRWQNVLGSVADFLTRNADAVVVVGGVIAGLAATVLVLNGALRAYTAVQTAVKVATTLWTGAQWLLNAAMAANPIGLVVVAIAAVIAIVAVLWNRCEGFRNVVMAVWEAIRKGAEVAWEWIKKAVEAVVKAVTAYVNAYKTVVLAVWNAIKTAAKAAWDFIKTAVRVVVDALRAYINAYKTVVTNVWNAIKTAASKVWESIRSTAKTAWDRISSAIKTAMDKAKAPIESIRSAFEKVRDMVNRVISAVKSIRFPSPPAWLSNLVGGSSTSAASVSASPSASRVMPTASTSTATQAPVQVTVNGALDPDAVGRQIEDILTRRARRTGARSLGQPLFA